MSSTGRLLIIDVRLNGLASLAFAYRLIDQSCLRSKRREAGLLIETSQRAPTKNQKQV